MPRFLAVEHFPAVDPTLITFKERAKKCGITIEPIGGKTEIADINQLVLNIYIYIDF